MAPVLSSFWEELGVLKGLGISYERLSTMMDQLVHLLSS